MRLVLREFHQDDLKDLLTWERHPGVECGEVQVQQFLNFCFREYFISGMGPWGMLLKNTGGWSVIVVSTSMTDGRGKLLRRSAVSCEAGWHLRPWGRS
jgi:hypothetical protein